MSDGAALEVALRLKALADPVRVEIMSYLFSSSAGQKISGELADVLMLSESAVSQCPLAEMVFGCIAAGRTLAGIHIVPALIESRSG
jgi:hypothetical protein